jgi:hypothetical protein
MNDFAAFALFVYFYPFAAVDLISGSKWTPKWTPNNSIATTNRVYQKRKLLGVHALS